MFAFVSRISVHRLFIKNLATNMKGKRSKRSDGKKRQEDPPVFSFPKQNKSHTRLTPSDSASSKAIHKHSDKGRLPESSSSSGHTDELHFNSLSSNFWAKSKEKYQKISHNKRKKSLEESVDNKDTIISAKKVKIPITYDTDPHKNTPVNKSGIKESRKSKKSAKVKKPQSVMPSDEHVEKLEILGQHSSGQKPQDDDDIKDTMETKGQNSQDERMEGVDVFGTPCGVILTMKSDSEISFHGNCRLTLLCGSVSVFGNDLRHQHRYDFYSPDTNSFLSLKCQGVADRNSVVEDIFHKYKIEINRKGDNTDVERVAVVRMEYLDTSLNNDLPQINPFQNIFNGEDERPERSHEPLLFKRVGVTVVKDGPRVVIPDDYQQVLQLTEKLLRRQEDSVTITVVGGKNSGKSTMNRYLVNFLLNRVKEVYFLECDVGQTELTPPGCVSLHCITEPLLGPPFTHQRKPAYSCFFGGVTPADDPTRYLACIEQCFSHYQDSGGRTKPLVINTMGWNKGVGLALTVDTIRLVRPSVLVQINTQNTMKNFPPMSTDLVWNEPGWNGKVWDMEKWSHMNEVPNYEWLTVNSPVSPTNSNIARYKPVEHRDLVILGYFLNGLDPEKTLISQQPYTVPWKSVAVHVCHEVVENSEILYAINCAIVALCVADLEKAEKENDESPYFFQTTPVCRCLGFGIVKCIDPLEKMLHIITPLNLEDVQRVNTLIKGNVNLPQQLLLKQKCDGELPYVTNPISSAGSLALRQRHMLPRKQQLDNNTGHDVKRQNEDKGNKNN